MDSFMFVWKVFFVFGFVMPSGYAVATEANLAKSAIVQAVQGEAYLVRAKEKKVLVTFMPVKNGDTIETATDGSVELLLQDGSSLIIGANSKFVVQTMLAQDSNWGWAFDLVRGAIRSIVNKAKKGKVIRQTIHTPVGTIGVRGTEFVLQHQENTSLHTLSGKVITVLGRSDFSDPKKYQEVTKAKYVEITADGMSEPKPFSVSNFKQKKLPTLLLQTMNKTAEVAEKDSLDTSVLFELLKRKVMIRDEKALAALLKLGAPINHQDENGHTVLMLAASANYLEIVDLLLKQPKVDSTILDKKGLNAHDHLYLNVYTDPAAIKDQQWIGALLKAAMRIDRKKQ